jgi:hypothetical protein
MVVPRRAMARGAPIAAFQRGLKVIRTSGLERPWRDAGFRLAQEASKVAPKVPQPGVKPRLPDGRDQEP